MWMNLKPSLSLSVSCTAAASGGRSGGGLFDAQNRLYGVLTRYSGFDHGYAGWSFYSHPKTIHAFLAKHKLSHLYKP